MNKTEGVVRVLNHDGRIITIQEDEIETIGDGALVITIKPNDDTTVYLSTSCTKSVAIAKLLGWLKGTIFPKIMVRSNKRGRILYIELLRILEEEDSLQKLLSFMRNIASNELAVAKASSKPEEFVEKQEALANLDSLISKASIYTLDIDEELSKGEDSEIIIDPAASKEKGVIHIKLRSLNRWAKQKYGISVLDDEAQPNLAREDNQAQPTVTEEEEDPNPEEGLTSTVANNVFTTFGFLIEAFAKTKPGYGGDKPNVSQIAKHIEGLATNANSGKPMKGQGREAIRKRITQAMDTKNSNLPQR